MVEWINKSDILKYKSEIDNALIDYYQNKLDTTAIDLLEELKTVFDVAKVRIYDAEPRPEVE